MADYFAAHIAYNPDTEELVRNATFQVFSVDDLSFTTPLELTEAGSGAALPLLVSNRDGAVPAFRVAGEPTQVLVKSGTYVSPLTSVYGTRGAAGKSAYQSAVDGGFLGDEETFTEYLAAVGKGIAVAEIIEGDLQITTKDGEVFTPGQVVGGDGRGISSVAVVDGDLVVTYTDATSQNAGSAAGPPGPPVDTDGATTGQVYTFNGTEPTWAAPAAGIENAPSTWPSTFPPAAHNTETSTLRVSSAALSADVLALLASAA